MTTPKVNTIKRGDARFYVEPATGEKAPGVTSVVGMLPKPFLTFWAAKMVAEFVSETPGSVVDLLVRGEKQAAIDLMKGAPRRSTSAAAETGTAVHDLFERMAKGETLGRVHPEYAPYVAHFEEFLQEFSPEFVFMEETVWNSDVNYAGSFDAIAKIGGETVVVDWKTTRSGVHAEVALQLAAYRHASHLVRPDGSRVPMPKIDGGAVLHVRPEGWGLYPIRCDEEIFDLFRHLREIFRWEKEVKDGVVGVPVNVNPAKTETSRKVSRPRTARPSTRSRA